MGRYEKVSAGEAFIKQYVIPLGFFGGVFFVAGVDPETAVLSALNPILPGSAGFAILLGFISTAGGLWGSYDGGGILGLFAVGLAFASGVFIMEASGDFWVLVLFISLVLGFIAPYCKVEFSDFQ